MALYNEVTRLVDKGRMVGIVYLDFSKAFGTVFHNIFIDWLTKQLLYKWIKN